MRRRTATKAESPSERILVQDILNYVQQIIIDEQRAGRAIEDEYQSATGAALDEDIPPLPFPEVPAKNGKSGKVSALAVQRRATVRQVHIDEAIAEASSSTTATTPPPPAETAEKDVRKLAKVFKKKKVRRCRERVAALVKVRRYLEEMLAE